jgi:hypothetical protein
LSLYIDHVVQRVNQYTSKGHKFEVDKFMKVEITGTKSYKWLMEILEEVHNWLLMVCPMSEYVCQKLVAFATAAFVARVKSRLKSAATRLKKNADRIKQAPLRTLLGDQLSNVTQAIGHAIMVLISVESDTAEMEDIQWHIDAATEVMEHVTVDTLRGEINALSNFTRSSLLSRPSTHTQGV